MYNNYSQTTSSKRSRDDYDEEEEVDEGYRFTDRSSYPAAKRGRYFDSDERAFDDVSSASVSRASSRAPTSREPYQPGYAPNSKRIQLPKGPTIKMKSTALEKIYVIIHSPNAGVYTNYKEFETAKNRSKGCTYKSFFTAKSAAEWVESVAGVARGTPSYNSYIRPILDQLADIYGTYSRNAGHLRVWSQYYNPDEPLDGFTLVFDGMEHEIEFEKTERQQEWANKRNSVPSDKKLEGFSTKEIEDYLKSKNMVVLPSDSDFLRASPTRSDLSRRSRSLPRTSNSRYDDFYLDDRPERRKRISSSSAKTSPVPSSSSSSLHEDVDEDQSDDNEELSSESSKNKKKKSSSGSPFSKQDDFVSVSSDSGHHRKNKTLPVNSFDKSKLSSNGGESVSSSYKKKRKNQQQHQQVSSPAVSSKSKSLRASGNSSISADASKNPAGPYKKPGESLKRKIHSMPSYDKVSKDEVSAIGNMSKLIAPGTSDPISKSVAASIGATSSSSSGASNTTTTSSSNTTSNSSNGGNNGKTSKA